MLTYESFPLKKLRVYGNSLFEWIRKFINSFLMRRWWFLLLHLMDKLNDLRLFHNIFRNDIGNILLTLMLAIPNFILLKIHGLVMILVTLLALIINTVFLKAKYYLQQHPDNIKIILMLLRNTLINKEWSLESFDKSNFFRQKKCHMQLQILIFSV